MFQQLLVLYLDFYASTGTQFYRGWNRSWWVLHMERIVISDAAVVTGARMFISAS
jgi:hypothetical protein